MKNRFEFIKNIYKDYIIFIVKKDKYYMFGNDALICKHFDIDVRNVKKININYLILDNLDIIEIKKYDNNLYYEYLIKSLIINYVLKK